MELSTSPRRKLVMNAPLGLIVTLVSLRLLASTALRTNQQRSQVQHSSLCAIVKKGTNSLAKTVHRVMRVRRAD